MSKAEDAARIMFEQMEWFKEKFDEEERGKKNLTKSDTNDTIERNMKRENRILLKRHRIENRDPWGPEIRRIELWLLADGQVERIEIVEDDGFMRGRTQTTHSIESRSRCHYTEYPQEQRKEWRVDPEDILREEKGKENPNGNPN